MSKTGLSVSTSVLVALFTSAFAAVACAPVGQDSSKPGARTPTAGQTTAGPRKANFGQPADPASVKKGGELTIALNAEPDTLDPTQSRSLVARQIFHASCEKLYDVNAEATVVAQLATALPTVSDDSKTVTIPLREGVKFADGTPFNSAAVKTSLLRNRDLETSARRSELGPITTIDTPDPKTVVIHLSAPFAPLTAALADRAGMVLSPAAVAKLGDKFGNAPICVGPFKVARRVPQNSIELVPDPNYYDKAKVHFDKVSYRIITDASIRAANLQSGDAQVADTLSTQDIPALESDKKLQILESDSLGYQSVTFNLGNVDGLGTAPKPIDKPHAKDVRVRQAFSLAVNRQQLVKAVFGGIFTAACTPVSPASEYTSDEAQKCPAADPAKARALLKDARVQTPYKMELLYTNTPDGQRLAQVLQAMVKESGFELTLQPSEFSALLDRQDNGDFEALQIGWSGRIDPDANITNFLGTKASQNVSGFSDPKLDDLLSKARASQDKAERTSLYGQVSTSVQETLPIVYLYRQRNLTGISNEVLGVQMFPDGLIRVAFAGYAK